MDTSAFYFEMVNISSRKYISTKKDKKSDNKTYNEKFYFELNKNNERNKFKKNIIKERNEKWKN